MPARKVMKVLYFLGFKVVRRRGSHVVLKLTKEEFLKLLEKIIMKGFREDTNRNFRDMAEKYGGYIERIERV